MYFLSQSLIIEPTKIHFTGSNEYGTKSDVTMEWERDLLSGSVSYICENGGDILEIGFGLGIPAGYIQSHSITSHTIIEPHPDLYPLAQAWAADKPNVTVITQNWYEVLDTLSTYDGVLYDTYGDENVQFLSSSLTQLVKPGGKVTWWNPLPTSESILNIPDTQFEEFIVDPPQNTYFNHNKYFMPKKQF